MQYKTKYMEFNENLQEELSFGDAMTMANIFYLMENILHTQKS